MTRSLKWVAILVAIGLTACGKDRKAATGSGSATDGAAASGPIGVRVGVTYGAIALGGDIDVQVACGADYSSELRLTPSASDGGTAQGDLAAVPVGVDCAFGARGTEHRADLAIDVHYSASLTARFEPSSDHAQVLLVLQADDGPAPAAPTTSGAQPAAAPPRIEGLSASGNSAAVVGELLPQLEASLPFVPSAAVVLSAAVDHGDAGALRTRWDDGGAGGTFFDLDPAQGVLVRWTQGEWRSLSGAIPTTVWIPPPGMAGTVRLTLIIEEVGDPAPIPRGISVTVVVTVDDSRVQAGFHGVLNHWPDVLSMQAVIDAQSAGGQVVPGQRARVDAAARDVDGDPLTATFAADCPGAFFDGGGQQLTFPLSAPADGGGTARLSVYFVPATIPASTYCEVTLDVDDGRGGTTRGYLLLKVLTEPPVAYGPIIDFARSSAQTIGPDTEVSFEVDARSRYGDPVLRYHVDLLSAIAIPQDNLPADMATLGGFVGDRTNETGTFTWRSPATEADCLNVESMNAGATFYFLITVTDEPAQSAGVPALNYVVIPIDVQCTAAPTTP